MNATFVQNSMLVIAMMFASSASGIELIRNGSFEEDGYSGARLTAGWNDGEVPGFNVHRYPYFEDGENLSGGNTTFDFPPGFNRDEYNGPVAPNGAGNLFSYAWGRTADMNGMFTGFGAQHVDVSNHAGRRYEFSAWLASQNDSHYAIVEIQFFDAPDASGESLGLASFDGNDQLSPFIVGSLSLGRSADPSIVATQGNWTLYSASGTVPGRASSAAVRILGRSVAPGSVNFGFVDLVSLQVVPEPTALVLLGTLSAILVVRRRGWRLRRKASSK